MNRLAKRVRPTRLVVGSLALLAAACTTPVIPIPPPDPAAMTFTLDTNVNPPEATFAYTVPTDAFANALVYVVDETQGQGVVTTANVDGTVTQTRPWSAQAQDRVVVTFSTADDMVARCVILRAGTLGPNDVCP